MVGKRSLRNHRSGKSTVNYLTATPANRLDFSSLAGRYNSTNRQDWNFPTPQTVVDLRYVILRNLGYVQTAAPV